MHISCVSCQSLFRLDSSFVKTTGSLVRCSKCEYIFMVHPPAYADDEPVVKDTKIDQSILDELLEVEKIKRYQSILDQTSDKINNQQFDAIASIKDFEEEEDDYQDPDTEDIEFAQLPDLSEFEDLIDWDDYQDPDTEDAEFDQLPDLSEFEDLIGWDDLPDMDDPTEHEKQFYNRTQDLDINEG